MKKVIFFLFLILIVLTGWVGWAFFGPTLNDRQVSYLYLATPLNRESLLKKLVNEKVIPSSRWANILLKLGDVEKVKAGRYKIKKGMSLFQLVRNVKNGKHTPVKLVINKIRTREELAGLIGSKLDFKVDSTEIINYLASIDSLKPFSVDTNQVLSIVMPYTYEFNWAETPAQFLQQFYTSWDQFWTTENVQKAKKKGLTPLEVSTLASIVEEETNRKEDRYNIASTYLNRLKIGMKLQADPTAKYATRNFKLNRILYGHLNTRSPYNTYLYAGLPPGPICTPSLEALQAVLEAPETTYLFFVASWKFDGSTIFSSTYKEHQGYVKLFHEEQLKRLQ